MLATHMKNFLYTHTYLSIKADGWRNLAFPYSLPLTAPIDATVNVGVLQRARGWR